MQFAKCSNITGPFTIAIKTVEKTVAVAPADFGKNRLRLHPMLLTDSRDLLGFVFVINPTQ